MEGLGGLADCEPGRAVLSSVFSRFSSLAKYAASRECRFGVRKLLFWSPGDRSIPFALPRASSAGVEPLSPAFGRFSSLARHAASRDCLFGFEGLCVLVPSGCSNVCAFSRAASTDFVPFSRALGRFSPLARYAASRDCLFGLK